MPSDSDFIAYMCARTLRLTTSEVLAIARTGPKRYKSYQIEKRDGSPRQISQPSRELKSLQYVLISKILRGLPVHSAATAYTPGSSIRENAARHANGRVIYKLDFDSFFPSIRADDWRRYARAKLPHWSAEDISLSQLIMFWGAGTVEPTCLAIGAPSSPYLSNILMYDFDNFLERECKAASIVYTRYADDLAFSSSGHLDIKTIRRLVLTAIKTGFVPLLRLKEEKTVLASKSTHRQVTGLTLSNEGGVSLGRDRKRKLSAMIDHARRGTLDPQARSRLRGWLAFAADVEPSFLRRMASKYTEKLIYELMQPPS